MGKSRRRFVKGLGKGFKGVGKGFKGVGKEGDKIVTEIGKKAGKLTKSVTGITDALSSPLLLLAVAGVVAVVLLR